MANNYISQYLRRAGIKAPYEDMTTAQLGEQNKSNPLSGYGFMSAQQKQQRQLEMQLLEKEQQRQQDMMQQQLVAAMSSQEKIGHYTGSGLMGLMQHLKSKGNAPEVPNAPPANDPELDRYNQMAAEVGPETALEMLGQETGNAGMIQQANTQRMDLKKKQLDIQNTESLIADRAKTENKPNQVLTIQRTGQNGKPMQVSVEAYGKDPKTGQNLYKELGEAVKGSVTDTNEGWSTSKGGIEQRTKNMEGALTSTANALDAYDRIDKLIKETPAGGWSGALVSKADEIISGVKNLATVVTSTEGREVTASLDSGDYDFKSLEKFAGGAQKIKSMVLQLAYAQAAATGDSSRSLSDRDVQNQIDIIGGQITNPNNFKSLMEQNKQVLVQKLDNLGRFTKIDGKPIGEAYREDIDSLKKRVGGASQEDEARYQRYLELKKKHNR